MEEKVGRVLPDEDPMLAWLPRQAADLLNRYKKGKDGRTPEARPIGKHWRKPAIAFGERLYFREVGEGTRVLKEGRYVGHHGRTGSLALDSDECQMPTDGILLDGIKSEKIWELSAPRPAAGERPSPEARVAPPQRRKPYIRRENVHKHGATEGCPGCTCVLENRRATVPHTEACRARIIEAMEKNETGAEESRHMQRSAKKTKRETDQNQRSFRPGRERER